MVFSGLRTLSTLNDLITPRFSAPELPLKKGILIFYKHYYLNLHHVHGEGCDGTRDHDQVHAVPHFSEVGARVENQTIVKNLQQHLDSEDEGEAIVQLTQELVPLSVNIDWILKII